jgi:hypothetical protein
VKIPESVDNLPLFTTFFRTFYTFRKFPGFPNFYGWDQCLKARFHYNGFATLSRCFHRDYDLAMLYHLHLLSDHICLWKSRGEAAKPLYGNGPLDIHCIVRIFDTFRNFTLFSELLCLIECHTCRSVRSRATAISYLRNLVR